MSLPASASLSSKKRKHVDVSGNASGSSHKKVKKDKEGKDKKKKSSSKVDGQFQVVNASVRVSIPPRFAMDPMAGAKEMLDSLVMHYVPALRGVMLCHSNARFLSQTAVIKNECPFSNCTVGFDATVWSPQIGMNLNGQINLCSPDHISLLVHRTFNVSIPRHHIPTDNWEFEYGAAENDPEFGPNAVVLDGKGKGESDTMDVDGAAPGKAGEETEETGGVWVHKVTGDNLGGKERQVEFTVIGLTVANQMLSLVGSIQPDPFSTHHVPQPAVAANAKLAANLDEEEEEDEPRHPQVPGQLDDEESDEDDPFSHLSRAGQDTAEREAVEKEQEKARAREEKARAKEEKRKRKKEKRDRREREQNRKASQEE